MELGYADGRWEGVSCRQVTSRQWQRALLGLIVVERGWLAAPYSVHSNRSSEAVIFDGLDMISQTGHRVTECSYTHFRRTNSDRLKEKKLRGV